jgi:hypothetical protein
VEEAPISRTSARRSSGGEDEQLNNKIQLTHDELMIKLDIVHD